MKARREMEKERSEFNGIQRIENRNAREISSVFERGVTENLTYQR